MRVGKEQVRSQLEKLDEYEFEHFVADLWEKQGWKTTVTRVSNDRGIDVIAEKRNPIHLKHVIQAKRYTRGNKIGSPDIQQYSSLLHQENDVDAVIIVTTSSFSSQAIRTARDLNVKLIDGNDLLNIIKQTNSDDIIKKYLDIEEPESQNTEREQKSVDTEKHSSPPQFIDSFPFRWLKATPDTEQEVDGEPIPWTYSTYLLLLCAVFFYPLAIITTNLPEGEGWRVLEALGLMAFFFLWIVSPLAVVYDSRTVSRYSSWKPYYRIYALSVFWVVYVMPMIAIFYLIRRVSESQ